MNSLAPISLKIELEAYVEIYLEPNTCRYIYSKQVKCNLHLDYPQRRLSSVVNVPACGFKDEEATCEVVPTSEHEFSLGIQIFKN